MHKHTFVLFTLLAAACGGSTPRPSSGGEEVRCPDGSANGGRTIRTVNCTTVVQYDGDDFESSVNVPGLVQAGIKNADKVLREVSQAATDAQVQFTQTCETYNACGLTTDEYRSRLDEAQTHFRAIREKVSLLEASQGNPAVLRNTVAELYTTTVPPAVQAQSALTLDLVVQAKRKGAASMEVLRDGARLHTGDQLVLGVRLSQPAHLYVFQRNEKKAAIEVLFPNAQINDLTNPIPALQTVRVPPRGNVFTLDANDIGEERVFVVASRVPLHDLQTALAKPSGAHDPSDAQLGQAVGNLFAEGSPECRDGQRGLTVTSESPCSAPTRGLTPTPTQGDDFFKEESTLRARTLPGDDVILRTFVFHHE